MGDDIRKRTGEEKLKAPAWLKSRTKGIIVADTTPDTGRPRESDGANNESESRPQPRKVIPFRRRK